MAEFKERLLTSFIGIPVILAAVYLGGAVFLVLVETVIILGLLEFFQLTHLADRRLRTAGLSIAILLSLLLYLNNGQNHFFHNNPGDLLISIGFLVILTASIFSPDLAQAWHNGALVFTGIFYLAWNLSFLLLIREEFAWGREYTFFVFLVIWAVDIGAYFSGTRWGRNKLAPAISPHKTWEGAIGGLAFGLLIALVFKVLFLEQKPWLGILALALAIAVIGQIGDLVESALKRNFAAKDSGSLLPGHGGILDRFDSLLLASPAVYYLIKFFL